MSVVKFKNPILFCLAVSLLMACNGQRHVNQDVTGQMPRKILWAWERAEDLRFLESDKIGVAFLAQTLTLRKDDVVFRPRRQPLEMNRGIYLIAVTRIESDKSPTERATLSTEQQQKVVNLVKKTLELSNVRAVQIDFDAVVSERKFYREMMFELRKNLPENVSLTMTALASWCVGDNWFNDLPVDEAVPMAFEMGADDKSIRDFLAKENDWREPLCRGSYGLSLDEPLNVKFKPDRKFFYFKSTAWQKSDLEKLNQ